MVRRRVEASQLNVIDSDVAPACDVAIGRYAASAASLAAHPAAVHPRYDHGAARAMLLDVARVAFALGVGPGIIEAVRHRIDRMIMPVRIDRLHPDSGA